MSSEKVALMLAAGPTSHAVGGEGAYDSGRRGVWERGWCLKFEGSDVEIIAISGVCNVDEVARSGQAALVGGMLRRSCPYLWPGCPPARHGSSWDRRCQQGGRVSGSIYWIIKSICGEAAASAGVEVVAAVGNGPGTILAGS